jgi:DNA polymerase-3 subunit delta
MKGRIADPEACQLLTAYVGTSLRAIQNEVEKVLIAVGDRPQVTAEDIASVVGVSRGYTVFDLQNAVGRKDLSEAIRIIRRMLELGEQPVFIVLMLTQYFTKLWLTQELRQEGADSQAIMASIKVSSYFVKDYVAASATFSSAEIEHAFGALLLADVQLKTSMIDPKVGMELLAYSLIKGSSAPTRARK